MILSGIITPEDHEKAKEFYHLNKEVLDRYPPDKALELMNQCFSYVYNDCDGALVVEKLREAMKYMLGRIPSDEEALPRIRWSNIDSGPHCRNLGLDFRRFIRIWYYETLQCPLILEMHPVMITGWKFKWQCEICQGRK